MSKKERKVLLLTYLLVSGCFQAVQGMQLLGRELKYMYNYT